MDFNENAQLDPSQVLSGGGSGGRGGGVAIGGGLGLIIMILGLIDRHLSCQRVPLGSNQISPGTPGGW